MASRGELIPLEEFVRGLPRPRSSAAGQGQGEKRGAAAGSSASGLRKQFPWLAKHFDGGDGGAASDNDGAAWRPEGADELGDDEVDAAFEALDAKRREWDAHDLTVLAGEIPRDLNGVYLRNTENPLLPALSLPSSSRIAR